MKMQLLKEPHGKGLHEEHACPVCNKPFVPWCGTRLQCHAKCLFENDEIKDIQSDPRTDKMVAEKYGVTNWIIRSVRKLDITNKA